MPVEKCCLCVHVMDEDAKVGMEGQPCTCEETWEQLLFEMTEE